MINPLPALLAAINVTPDQIKVPNQNRAVDSTVVSNVLNLVFGLAGAIAVLIITIGALKYVLSQGNPQAAAQAKDTILYALVGLVITMIGYGVVTFVVGNL